MDLKRSNAAKAGQTRPRISPRFPMRSRPFRILPICSFYVLIIGMTKIDPDRVARALLNAPGWARVGLTAPTEMIREAAAQELALTIARIDGEPSAAADPNQLVLAL